MPNVTFILKEPKAKTESLVYLIYWFHNQRLKYSTGQKIHPKFWSTEKQKAKETRQFPGFMEFNALLKKLETTVHNEYRRLLNEGIYPTPDKFKKPLDECLQKRPVSTVKDLLTFARIYINESTKRPNTIKNYEQAYRVLQEFKDSSRSSLHFDAINLEFYDSFMKHCNGKGYSQNTIGGLIKNIKVFMNEAFDRQLTSNIEYKHKKFKTIEEESHSIYLNKSELSKLAEIDLSNKPKLDRVRDLFLIGCYTGLRYSDLCLLQPENFDLKGKLLKIKTQKTGETVVMPLHPFVTKALSKYDGKLPPAISNQKMNDYVKDVCQLADISDRVQIKLSSEGKMTNESVSKFELVSVHTARRSFATNAYLSNVPTLSIMKLTGHKSEKSFLKYIKMSQEENAHKLLNHPFFN